MCQQQLFALSSDQTCTEFGQDHMVKARVAEFQPEGILEVDAAAHRIDGLTVGKSFSKLHHGDNAKRQGASAGWPVWENKWARDSS
jgi:hypothetical protein